MVVKLRVAYNRPLHQESPYVWFGVTKTEFENVIERVELIGGRIDRNIIVRQLHHEQPWFHGEIDRKEAEQRLHSSGQQLIDGTFLVREKRDGSFALSLIHQGNVWHYAIAHHPTHTGQRRMWIEKGPPFENLMDLVTYYHCGGLHSELSKACCRPNFSQIISPVLQNHLDANPMYGRAREPPTMMRNIYPSSAAVSGVDLQNKQLALPTEKRSYLAVLPSTASSMSRIYPPAGDEEHRPPPSCPPPPPGSYGQYIHPPSSSSGYTSPINIELQSSGRSTNYSISVQSTSTHSGSSQSLYGGSSTDAESDTYNALRRHLDHTNLFDIRYQQLLIEDDHDLGSGQFGTVKLAHYNTDDRSYVVAVKILKNDPATSNLSKKVLMKEAVIMSELDDPYIIRMIGLCKSHSMLVLEYAPLGPLKEYLKDNRRTTRMECILELMLQVAKGMSYLTSKGIVHRDLAARNILLMSRQHAKISDFGLSREMSTVGKDYYQASMTGDEAWPIKWYAPECLKQHKFDSLSDVWSYGVTLWEATSYGKTPFKGLTAKEYRRAIDRNDRLKKPEGCPKSVYGLMHQCWLFEREVRPTFPEIVKRLKRMTFMEDLECNNDDTVPKEID